MGIPSGLDSQLMIGEESTYGTIVTPNRTYEYRPPETLKLDIGRIESQALRSGQRLVRSDRWYPGKRSVKGDVNIELANKSMGLWFKHAFGGVATTQPDAVGNPTVYLHTFTPGDIPTGLTIQVGKPDTGATKRPFTYSGCRLGSWKLESKVDDIPIFTASIIGRDEDLATALAVPSYPANVSLMVFTQGTLTVGGSPMDVKSFTMDGNNGLAEDRFFLGSALRKSPLEASMRTYTGKLEPEFESLTAYQRFVNGTEASLVLQFVGATISTTYKFQTTITANVRFDGETPNVGGPGIVQQPLAYKVTDTGSTSISLAYQTTDTAP